MGNSDFSWKLADHPKLPKGKTVAVVVLDGWGEANPDKYNCIHVAETPTMDSLKQVHVLPAQRSPFFLWIIVRCIFSMSTYGYPCNAITRILVSTMDLFCSCCASLFALFRCQLVLNAYVLLHILFMTHIPFKVFQSSLNGHHVIFVSLRRTLNIS